MRWSQLLPIFILLGSAFFLVCDALVIPPTCNDLVRRTTTRSGKQTTLNKGPLQRKLRPRPVKKPKTQVPALGSSKRKKDLLRSSNYRKNAALRDTSFVFHSDETITTKASKRKGKMSRGTGKEADHMYELQMIHKNLEKNGHTLESLPHSLRTKLIGAANHVDNMAFIPPHINNYKGKLITAAMKGPEYVNPHDVDPKPFVQVAHSAMKASAEKFDSIFAEHNRHALPKDKRLMQHSFKQFLDQTVTDAGVNV